MADLYLIDGSGIAYRAFFAIGNWMSTSDGKPTNAIFGVSRMMLKILNDYIKKDEDSILFVMDKKTKTYRHELLESYKAQRPKAPDEFIAQLPNINEMVENLGINVIAFDKYEADDVIATAAIKYKNDYDNIFIITSDKDMMQLIKENIFILRPEKGTTDIKKYDSKEVENKMGVFPNQIIDLLALMGDSSDNIPGVKGIGIKTAQKLLAEFKTLENIYENIYSVKGATKKKLIENKEMAFLSQKLVKLMLDAPLDFKKEDILYTGYKKELKKFLEKLEFSSLIKELELGSSNDTENKIDYSKKGTYKELKPENIDELISIMKKNDFICFDTETTSLDPFEAKLLGIAFSFKSFEGFYLNLKNINENEKKNILKKIIPILNEKKVIGQNLKYDISILNRYGYTINNPYFDTMIAAYLINPDSRKFNMDDLAQKYLNYTTKKYKEVMNGKLFSSTLEDIDEKTVLEYAAEDSDITFRLYEVLSKELHKKDLIKIFTEIEMPIVPILANMELNGVYFDSEDLKKLSTEYQKILNKIEEKMSKFTGEEFNPNSPKQVGELLFEKLGLKGKKKTKSGNYSTDAESLELLKNDHEIISEILEYRKYQKLLSTYINSIPKLINKKTGRVHTSFNQTGTATGRLSSSDPNLQNLPIREPEGEKIRKTIKVQDNNNILISADYSQIELRVLAHISQDEVLLKAYNTNDDIHSITASKIFNVDQKNVDSNMRRIGKMVNFSLVYGSTPYGLSQKLNIPFKDAKLFIDRYFELYKAVEKNQDDSINKAKENGFVETLFGRKRFMKNIRTGSHDLKRITINTPIQGTAADIMKIAMIKLFKNLPDYAKMILQVHDEILIEAPENKKEEIKNILVDCMENSVKLSVPLKVDVSFGKIWNK
ncbi:DNA polymerase I [Oceanotoga sp. DSM 15011]|uniref:DNA polymerase I n=1 Tax=Oceanotoga sp. DSM 15011 TaxID=2984951 RepID=UPI0021F3C887|nr:DNA polymerase I [Oceanotoga sp. DSM 15011]UYP01036.1 DNA polymerase I [Oceanotoga sp. DSM 15011]